MLQDEIKRLKALEALLRRELKMSSWRDKMHSDEVLVRVNEERYLIKTIRQRQKNWIEHMLRGDDLLEEDTEGEERSR